MLPLRITFALLFLLCASLPAFSQGGVNVNQDSLIQSELNAFALEMASYESDTTLTGESTVRYQVMFIRSQNVWYGWKTGLAIEQFLARVNDSIRAAKRQVRVQSDDDSTALLFKLQTSIGAYSMSEEPRLTRGSGTVTLDFSAPLFLEDSTRMSYYGEPRLLLAADCDYAEIPEESRGNVFDIECYQRPAGYLTPIVVTWFPDSTTARRFNITTSTLLFPDLRNRDAVVASHNQGEYLVLQISGYGPHFESFSGQYLLFKTYFLKRVK